MAEPRPIQPPDDLDRALHDLGRQLDWPPEPNLLPSVREQLRERRRPSLLARFAPRTVPSRLAWATSALVVVVTLVLVVSDSTRTTVADRLGVPGISIATNPTSTVSPGDRLQIGVPTSIEEAVEGLGGRLVMPPVDILGTPDEVYVLELDKTVQVSYVYLPRHDLPEAGTSGVGLLISQFEGNTNDSFIEKQIGPDTTIELTEVNGRPAYWLTGAPHVFFYEGPDGQIYEESIRLAADVLLWEQDGKTLRIEGALDRDRAVQIAEAMSGSS